MLATQPSAAKAIVGLVEFPNPCISNIWQMYEKFNQAGLAGLSEGQMSKHKVSRERAIKCASNLLDDIRLSEVTRADVLRYRQWWTDKLHPRNLKLTAQTAVLAT